MRTALLEQFRCPISQTSLRAETFESGNVIDGMPTIRTGLLWSEAGYWYPIINHVPVMLVFSTAMTDAFAAAHAARINALPGAPRRPDREPELGERSVQRTFTEEWGALEDDALNFTYDEAELVALHRDVWLRMAEPERLAVRSVLNVGIGYGAEAMALAALFPNARVTGVDLNLAVVSAGRRLVETTRVDPVVASLFHLPFADASFDHVHSQGVLHHTWSTKAAFDAIERKVGRAGTLFVWLYAAEDPYVVHGLRGLLVKLYWWISHGIFRPVLSRAPAFLRNAVAHLISLVLHPVLARRGRHRGRWTYANTLHGIRDAFTPRYAHQHGFNEVVAWYEDAGYEPRLQSPATYRKLFGGRLVGVGVNGRRQPQVSASP